MHRRGWWETKRRSTVSWKEPGSHPRQGHAHLGDRARRGPGPTGPRVAKDLYPESQERPTPKLVVYLPTMRGLCAVYDTRLELSFAITAARSGR